MRKIWSKIRSMFKKKLSLHSKFPLGEKDKKKVALWLKKSEKDAVSISATRANFSYAVSKNMLNIIRYNINNNKKTTQLSILNW